MRALAAFGSSSGRFWRVYPTAERLGDGRGLLGKLGPWTPGSGTPGSGIPGSGIPGSGALWDVAPHANLIDPFLGGACPESNQRSDSGAFDSANPSEYEISVNSLQSLCFRGFLKSHRASGDMDNVIVDALLRGWHRIS